MAVIDDTRGVLVVRIVYDGPAFSGKTSSVRALARGVGRSITTPAEHAGRTLFFDWVDYVGGLFDGRQIRCQIVGAPGQLELAHRREALLEGADAVVVVLDSRRSEWPFSRDWLERTAARCRALSPPVGVVGQINRRDAEDAVPMSEVRAELAASPPIPLVESTATSNEGIREAFVTAVRLALERVRQLAAQRTLAVGAPSVDSPEELLAWMREEEYQRSGANGGRSLEGGWHYEAAASSGEPGAGQDVVATSTVQGWAVAPGSDAEETPFRPDPSVPAGLIWPPLDGRALLAEVDPLGVSLRRTTAGDWSGSGSGFRFHSAHEALFTDASRAREALLSWARDHAANTSLLSAGRAVVLGDAGGGRLRLWQIVRSEAALRERLATTTACVDSHELVDHLLFVVRSLLVARARFLDATIGLPCTLWTVGATDATLGTFVGMMPNLRSSGNLDVVDSALLQRELGSHLRELKRARVNYQDIRSHVVALANTGVSEARLLAEVLPVL
jgi:signal recognition particle receptor subunit beta